MTRGRAPRFLGAALATLLLAPAAPAAAAEPLTPLTMEPSPPRAPVPWAVLVFPADASGESERAALEAAARDAVLEAGLTPIAPVAALEHHLVEIGCDAPNPRCLVRLAASVGAVAVVVARFGEGRLTGVLATARGRVVHAVEAGEAALDRAPSLFRTLLAGTRPDGGLRSRRPPRAPTPRPRVLAFSAMGAAGVFAAGAVYEAVRYAGASKSLRDPSLPPDRRVFLEAHRDHLAAGALGLGGAAVLLGLTGVTLVIFF